MPQDGANPQVAVGSTWVEGVPDLKERRRDDALHFTEDRGGAQRPYEGGLEEMLERGLCTLEPQGKRILLRGILPEDAISTGLTQLAYDSRRMILEKVLAVGPGCERYFEDNDYTDAQKIKPGDFVWVLSTVADRLSSRDKSCRLWTVPIKWVAARAIVK